MSDLGSAVAAWMAADPDPSTRAELVQLLDDPASAAETELEDRFAGRLSFGTAGLRGVMGAGPNRMNRLVVRAATEALASYLEAHLDGARQAGVVIGADARHHSADFAEEAASVLARSGFVVRLLPLPCPTPLLAFAVRHLSAAAGVMITASHNPPQYNGYKLYLGDGAQIVPPVDAEIEALIEEEARRPPAGRDDPGGSDDNASTAASGVRAAGVERLGDEVLNAYLDALGARFRAPEAARSLRIVYTPLHGVAGRVFSAALEQAGFAAPIVVAAQAEPDPDFPTVAFPNPEEPGALDLAIAEAEACKADLVVANDPDGDRMAIAVPDEGSPRGWRPLTGDEVGSLLGSYLLDATAPDATAPDATAPDRLVATTIVSSSLLGKLAAEAGARYAETLTGFKWIVRATDMAPGSRFLFGYEEALGYCVGDLVRDKDGISAALAFLSLVADARRQERTVLDLLDALALHHGLHVTSQLSLVSPDPGAPMEKLRAEPPVAFAARRVLETDDLSAEPAQGEAPPAKGPRARRLPPSDVLVYKLENARVVVRPSGTEPKLKVYFEVVREVGTQGLAAARRAAAGELDELKGAVHALVDP